MKTLFFFSALALLLSIMFVGPASAINGDAWADDMNDWGYRVPITITDAPTAANVQREINLTYQENMQADFDDIRFYTADGDSIDYWIEEKTDSTSADVWVKLPAADMTYIYVYYGNVAAEDASDPDSVFELFDDFDGTSIDTEKWVAYEGTTISNSVISAVDGSQGVVSIDTFGVNYIYETKASWAYNVVQTEVGFAGVAYFNAGSGYILQYQAISRNSDKYTTKLGTSYTGYHVWRIDRIGGTKNEYYIDGVKKATHTSQVSSGATVVTATTRSYTGMNLNVDWILIRKYDATTTVFTIGTPENNTLYVTSYPGYDLPTDQNSDGLYEDVNGNGRLDFQDIMIFFQYNGWAAANQPNVTCWDWSGNGAIEFSDVQAFWEREFT